MTTASWIVLGVFLTVYVGFAFFFSFCILPLMIRDTWKAMHRSPDDATRDEEGR